MKGFLGADREIAARDVGGWGIMRHPPRTVGAYFNLQVLFH